MPLTSMLVSWRSSWYVLLPRWCLVNHCDTSHASVFGDHSDTSSLHAVVLPGVPIPLAVERFAMSGALEPIGRVQIQHF